MPQGPRTKFLATSGTCQRPANVPGMVGSPSVMLDYSMIIAITCYNYSYRCYSSWGAIFLVQTRIIWGQSSITATWQWPSTPWKVKSPARNGAFHSHGYPKLAGWSGVFHESEHKIWINLDENWVTGGSPIRKFSYGDFVDVSVDSISHWSHFRWPKRAPLSGLAPRPQSASQHYYCAAWNPRWVKVADSPGLELANFDTLWPGKLTQKANWKMAQSKYFYPLITWWFSIVMLVHQRVSISTALLLVYGWHQCHQSHQPEPGITSSQQIGQVFHPSQARETLRTWKALEKMPGTIWFWVNRVERSKSINMGTEANMGVCVPGLSPVWKKDGGASESSKIRPVKQFI